MTPAGNAPPSPGWRDYAAATLHVITSGCLNVCQTSRGRVDLTDIPPQTAQTLPLECLVTPEVMQCTAPPSIHYDSELSPSQTVDWLEILVLIDFLSSLLSVFFDEFWSVMNFIQ